MKQSTAGTARGLSGEIMTPSGNPLRRLRPPGLKDVVEAEFEIAPGRTAVDLATLWIPQPGPVVIVKSRQRSGGAGFWSLGLLAAACAFWFSGGSTFFVKVPGNVVAMAMPRAELAGVTSSIDRSGESALVMVDGDVINAGFRSTEVPAIAIAVTDGNAATTRYLLRSANATIAPGEQFAFSGRLALPKESAETVKVEFAE